MLFQINIPRISIMFPVLRNGKCIGRFSVRTGSCDSNSSGRNERTKSEYLSMIFLSLLSVENSY